MFVDMCAGCNSERFSQFIVESRVKSKYCVNGDNFDNNWWSFAFMSYHYINNTEKGTILGSVSC